jgi:hypothetical protein
MTDSQIIGEIAAQHALLLELANQQRNTLAAVSALAELMISQAARSGDVNLREVFEDRCAEIHKQLKKQSIETLSRLSREVERNCAEASRRAPRLAVRSKFRCSSPSR